MKSSSMRDQEAICEMLKREATQLAKLRHPSCLQVVEAVDESRNAIAFATEPVKSIKIENVHCFVITRGFIGFCQLVQYFG